MRCVHRPPPRLRASISLYAIAEPAALDPGPSVTLLQADLQANRVDHRYTQSDIDRSRSANPFASSPLCGQPGDRRRRQSGATAEELLQCGATSLVDNPCRYYNGSISAICGDFRTHAGRIFDDYRCPAIIFESTLLSLTRGGVTEIAPKM